MATAQSAPEGMEKLRVVIFREEEMYVAQCIEFDIAAQAPTLEAVLDRLDLTVEAECQMSLEIGQTPFNGICPAPNHFHHLWEKGSMAIMPIRFAHPTAKD